MQTNRHAVFAVLALWATGCRQPVSSQAPEAPEPAPASEEPAPAAAAAPRKPSKKQVRTAVVGAPRIESARLESRGVLRLDFSEAVTPEPGFDPAQFRLSFAISYQEDDEPAVSYYDPGLYEDEKGRRLSVDRVEADGPDALLLHLSEMITEDLCTTVNELQIEALEDPGTQGGLYLHYAAKLGLPAIADDEGNPVGDIAAQWVLRGAGHTVYYDVRDPTPHGVGPIACPGAKPTPTKPGPLP